MTTQSTPQTVEFLRHMATKRPLEGMFYIEAAETIELLQGQIENSLEVQRRLRSGRQEARAELHVLKQKLTQAISECTPHDYGILKEEAQEMRRQRDESRAEVAQLKDTVAAYERATVTQSLTVRPEPSRLEIAAMFMVSIYARQYGTPCEIHALQRADALIAAAKEAK